MTNVITGYIVKNEAKALELLQQHALGAIGGKPVVKAAAAFAEDSDTKMLAELRRAAEGGDSDAQVQLANYIDNGLGMDKDSAQAVVWYRKAAEQGHRDAQYILGVALRKGEGIEKNEQQAVAWYRKAADAGLACSQYALALALADGTGTDKDEKNAVKWYQRAAKQGFVNAQINLGFCLEHGIGVAIDKISAVSWYRKAAEQGDPRAMFNLGLCYASGSGVTVDYEQAMFWQEKGGGLGFLDSKYELALLQSKARPNAHNPVVRWNMSQLVRRAAEKLYFGDFTIVGPLARSTFCQAVQCVWQSQDVVVKVPREGTFKTDEWMNEMLALSHLPAHRNLLKLMGTCHDFKWPEADGKTLAPALSYVTKFFEQGSIVDYFARREHAGKSASCLLPWALDIARGFGSSASARDHSQRFSRSQCFHRQGRGRYYRRLRLGTAASARGWGVQERAQVGSLPSRSGATGSTVRGVQFRLRRFQLRPDSG